MNNSCYEQGSESWKNARKGRITASKMPIIIGISPYQTPLQLFEEELGLRDPQTMKPHMQEGLNAEDGARAYFAEKTGVTVKPDVVFSKENPLFMASLDGINEERTLILEIKKNNSAYHEIARSGKVVEFHLVQMQMQMFCTGLDVCHYLSYRKGDEVIVIVPREEEMILKLVKQGLEFKRMLDELEEPALTDADYVDMSDNLEMSDLAQKYKYHTSMQKEHKDKADAIKEKMKALANDRNVKGDGFKLSKYTVKGRWDYDKILALHNINLDEYQQFKKAGTIAYRITT